MQSARRAVPSTDPEPTPPPAVGRTPWLVSLGGVVWTWAATAIFVLVVGLVLYFVPNTRVRFRDVWLGALATGLLWKAAFTMFSWYVTDLSRFSIHGSIAAVIVFLWWVFISAVIFIYGVECTAEYARLRARRYGERAAPPGSCPRNRRTDLNPPELRQPPRNARLTPSRSRPTGSRRWPPARSRGGDRSRPRRGLRPAACRRWLSERGGADENGVTRPACRC